MWGCPVPSPELGEDAQYKLYNPVQFRVKKESPSAAHGFLLPSLGAAPLSQGTPESIIPTVSPEGPAAAGQSTRRGRKPERSFFSAGNAIQNGRLPMFIVSPSQSKSTGSLFMP